MAFNNELKLNLPNSFPAREFEGFMRAARAILLPSKAEAWREFAGASNLIGWRFRSSYEDMMSYLESWRTYGADVKFEELYLRQRALFGMFVSGVSCIESTCYAAYALASHPSLLGLPFGDAEQKKCSPAKLRTAILSHSAAPALAAALKSLIDAREWRLWVDLRNRMTHRSNLPRIIRGAVGALPPPAKALQFAATSSTPAFEADEGDLDALFVWLSQSLGELLDGGRLLAERP